MNPLQPIDAAPLFPKLHNELIALLRSLSAEAWHSKTVSTTWTVKDVVAHLLDGDVRRLSMQRDGYQPPRPAHPVTDYPSLLDFLNELNRSWIAASKRMSPELLMELTEFLAPKVHQLFRELPPEAPAQFGVAWAGQSVSPNWFDIAREYTEKWYHQQQIREAAQAPLLVQREWLYPVFDAFVRGLPHLYDEHAGESSPGSSATVIIAGEAGGEWILMREKNSWQLYEGRRDDSDTTVEMNADTAWRLFTKNMSSQEGLKRMHISGNSALGGLVARLTAMMK